ncbi:MAG TPA: intradiol ring-cleavage dioxygenase [Candidatus Binataceae bacterium]|nr:intradiol ring-cleavage dioxygenase [Candidatus Binataceae bacterium]
MAGQKLTDQSITAAVLERLADSPNPRLKQVMESLVSHLHQFARDVHLTTEEWSLAIDFLTAAGHITDDKRQEFILLSDTLGLSALVDLMEHRDAGARATESSLLGPFYRLSAPEVQLGADISNGTPGEPLEVRGAVRSAEGGAICDALLDVWQAAPNGLYDVQDKSQSGMNLRARLRSDARGHFAFRTVKPASYPVPDDGPVGKMLRGLGRHPFRPAHIHFIVSAPGFHILTTALYINGDRYLETDAVFGSRPSLVVDCRRESNGAQSIDFDFVLARATRRALRIRTQSADG